VPRTSPSWKSRTVIDPELRVYYAQSEDPNVQAGLCCFVKIPKLWVVHNSHTFNKIAIALLATAGLALSSCTADDTAASDFSVVSPGTLTCAVQVDYPPFSFALEGQQVGFEVDLCGEIAKRLELEPVLDPTEFVDLIDSVESDQSDVILGSMTATDARSQQIEFGDTYYRSAADVFVNADSPLSSPTDLQGASLGVKKGTTFADAAASLPSVGPISEYVENPEVIQALAAGDVDAIFVSNLLVSYYKNLGQLDARGLGTQTMLDSASPGFNKGNTGLLAAVNSALAEIDTDGTYESLSQKWFGISNANVSGQ
jgi:polar amino acid transport system substrate-binding protein